MYVYKYDTAGRMRENKIAPSQITQPLKWS